MKNDMTREKPIVAPVLEAPTLGGPILLVLTLLVRNEEDIIEDTIWFHHAQGVDSFIITDNLSTDRTAAILKSLSRQLDIEYIFQSDDDYNQHRWVTEMARRASRDHHADWVINGDADEFWKTETGTLKSFLSSVDPKVGMLNIRRHNAVLTLDPAEPLLSRCHPMENDVFECNSLTSEGRPLPGKCLHRASDTVVVAQGNHSVQGVPGESVDINGDLSILHFPHRTFEHYRQKILVGGAAYGRNTELPAAAGSTWREQYEQLNSGAVDRYWQDISQPKQEVTIGLAMETLFRDSKVVETLVPLKQDQRDQKIKDAVIRLRQDSQVLTKELGRTIAGNIARIDKAERVNRPLYYNLEFCLRGPQRQLADIADLQGAGKPGDMSKHFAELRDTFSLYPANTHLKGFFGEVLQINFPEEHARLRADCADKIVVLHTSCVSRMHLAEASIASFAGWDSKYHHILLVGASQYQSEDETELCLNYDGRVLRVPVPDSYENLHRKIFYALTLLDLVADPSLVLKLDDDLLLKDGPAFETLLETLTSKGVEYAGRAVGNADHSGQWHGWHIAKCDDPLVEKRGYQFPLPRKYAAGGYGYVLGRRGLEACSYMYLAMKEFFAMKAIGLEDVCVGHALYAKGIDIHNVSSEGHILALPGLTIRNLAHDD